MSVETESDPRSFKVTVNNKKKILYKYAVKIMSILFDNKMPTFSAWRFVHRKIM